MNLGKLYLIPSPLGENDPAEVIPAPVLKSLEGFRTFVVEEVRTARRYLSKAGLKGRIGELQFFELNEHTDQATIEGYLKLFEEGNDVALISEAGLPAVADPGAQLVAPGTQARDRGASCCRSIFTYARTYGIRPQRSVVCFLRIYSSQDRRKKKQASHIGEGVRTAEADPDHHRDSLQKRFSFQ